MSGRIVCGAGFTASIARAPLAFGSMAPSITPSEFKTTPTTSVREEVGIGSAGCSRGRSSFAHCTTVGRPEIAIQFARKARRKIDDEVGQGAQLLAHRGRGLARQTANHPISLAPQVVRHLAIAKKFELRRSSRAQVSQQSRQ